MDAHSQEVEMFRSVITAGQNALRSVFLMNGAAAVAILTFIGNLANNDPQRIPSLAPSLTVFVSGVLLVTVASGATYLSQWFYAHPPKWSRYTGFTLNALAIVLAIASYCAFAWGIHDAYTVFASYGPLAEVARQLAAS